MQEGSVTPPPESAAEGLQAELGQSNVSAISAEELQCAVCYDVPPGEVHQCSRGHFLCLSCWDSMDRAPERLCGECRVPLPRTNRNLVAERAIQGLPQPPEQPSTPARASNRGAPLTPFLQSLLAVSADGDDDFNVDDDDELAAFIAAVAAAAPPSFTERLDQVEDRVLRQDVRNEWNERALERAQESMEKQQETIEKELAAIETQRTVIENLRKTIEKQKEIQNEAMEALRTQNEAIVSQNEALVTQNEAQRQSQRDQQRIVELEKSEDRLRLEVAVGAMMIESHQQRIVELEFHLQA